MLTCTFELTAQERVIHGKPAAEAVREEIERIRARRVLLLTTRSLAEGRLVREVSSALGDRCVGKFSAISAHSPREAVIAGAAIARETDADHLLAVGGGSVVDATKTMQIALWRGVRDVDALSALAVKRGTAPLSPLDGDRIRMTAVTTTLSAAEFTAGAGITDVQRKVKMHFRHPWMVPRTVILDPAATLETPMELFLSTGMRAMDHAVERWCSIQPHPVAEGLALQAMGMLAASMPAVKARPEDLEPRLNCQLGAWLTMIAPAALVPNGASHGIGYILGGYAGVPHGITSCISLAAALQWNEPVNAERQKAVAEKLGRPGARACDVMRDFVKSLGLPTRLTDVGIGADRIPELARQYDGTGPISTNPRPVRGAGDLEEILRLAV
ncbi:MAG TPA: iron-containing alcohol dehydrogenase [Burkholderiales bacterium]|nr:iron-containing alcohol dehydrogenase [Burkholderiales bacterium]